MDWKIMRSVAIEISQYKDFANIVPFERYTCVLISTYQQMQVPYQNMISRPKINGMIKVKYSGSAVLKWNEYLFC